MSRRLSVLASVILLLFVLIAAQSAWVQFFHSPALNASIENPRNVSTNSTQYQRGEILAADGTVLAQSVATSSRVNPWRRIYPLGALFSGVVGFTSTAQGNWALEAHSQPAQSFEQVLAPTKSADSVTLTLSPTLTKGIRSALAGRDGSVVAIVPSTGDVLALYSNPTFNPVPFTSFDSKVQTAAWKFVNKKDKEGF